MAKINREALNEKWAQGFKGGLAPLDKTVIQQLGGANCCEDGPVIGFDRLPSRLRFDNGLAHENPAAANAKFIPAYHTERGREMAAHFSRAGVGARFSVIVVPTYAVVRGIGIAVGSIPKGWELKLGWRKSGEDDIKLEVETGVTVTVTGDLCNPQRDSEASTEIPTLVPLDDKIMHKDFIAVTKPLIFVDAGELYLEVVQAAKGDKDEVTPVGYHDFDFSIGVNYDFLVRAEV